MSSSTQIAVVMRLDLAEVLRSRWALFCLAVYGVLAAVFVLVGMRESSVMGFTGIGRVLLSFTHALVLLIPLLGLTATGQVINSAREDGSLELLFSQPLSRTCYFAAISLVRIGALLVPLLVLMVLMALLGRFWFGQVIPWSFLFRTMAVSCSLLVASVAAGLLVSTIVRNQAKALMILLLLWACGCALLDFGLAGLMLQWQLQPQVVFLLAALNPVQDARLALLSAADPELANLGPVGFYLANHVGAPGLLFIGVAWPLLLGGTAWTLALYQLHRRDLV